MGVSSLTDDSRQQEPAKRQRRWNSEKSIGAVPDVKTPPKVLSTDTVKETIPAQSRDAVVHGSALGSPSTTVSSTPKTAATTSFEKPAASRPPLGRIDASVNGEAEKKRHGSFCRFLRPLKSISLDICAWKEILASRNFFPYFLSVSSLE